MDIITAIISAFIYLFGNQIGLYTVFFLNEFGLW